MTSADVVSVLVPAYNHERFIDDCLRGIVAQTHRPLELLIADDASRDGTAGQVERLVAEHRDRFIRVVFDPHPVNVGIAETLNRLLAHARGRFLFLNASDDVAEPDAISVLVDELSRHPEAALAVGDNAIIDDTGKIVFWDVDRCIVRDGAHTAFHTWGEYLQSQFPKAFENAGFGTVRNLYAENHVPNGKLLRRAAVERVGGWRAGTLEDWDLNFRLARRSRLRYIDRVLYNYRWHDSNTVKAADYMHAAALRTGDAMREQMMKDPLLALRVLGLPRFTRAASRRLTRRT